jgi:uncharacterized sulfatase
MEANSLAERTVVVFTSDNGGSPDYARSAPLRGSKWNLYEAGIRVPFIVRWPGMTQPGATCDVPVIGTDLFPTFCEMAGAAVDPTNPMDGKSIVPLLEGKAPQELTARPLYWHFPYYTPERKRPGLTAGIGVDNNSSNTINPPMSAIRSGDFKLIYFHEDQRSELYNLKDDESESSDLSEVDPARTKQLQDELFQLLKSVNARYPAPKTAIQRVSDAHSGGSIPSSSEIEKRE